MINYSYEYFYNKVIESKQKNKPFLFKNFINDEYIPKWETLLFSIYQESKEEILKQSNIDLISEWDSGLPIQIGNLHIYKNLFLTFYKEDRNRNIIYFKKLFDIFENIKTKTKINISMIGPKIFIGPAQNKSHIDNWDAFSLQCEGLTIWTLSDNKYEEQNLIQPNYLERFEINRGDLLFFPKGIWHQVDSFGPRANIQFNVELDNFTK